MDLCMVVDMNDFPPKEMLYLIYLFLFNLNTFKRRLVPKIFHEKRGTEKASLTPSYGIGAKFCL